MIMDWKNRRRLLGINVLLFAVLYLLVAFNKDYLRPAFGHIQFMGVLTGSLPNFLAAFLISLGAVNGVLSRRPERGRLLVYLGACAVFLVLAVEELRPMWGASSVYDLFDILASALGSVTAILVYELIARHQKEKESGVG